MEIVWDEEKNEWLQDARGVSFEQIVEKVLEGDYLDILENPSRPNQLYFVLRIQGYIWLVPFLIDERERIPF